MEKIVQFIIEHISKEIGKPVILFLISLLPILELRGGILAASKAFLNVPLKIAVPICFVGNIVPIPFILLLIKKIFRILRKNRKLARLVEKIESKALAKSEKIKKYEFWGLVFFVGVPLPGTGAWTGALIAALLDLDFKKAMSAIIIGLIIASFIMSIVYSVFGVLL